MGGGGAFPGLHALRPAASCSATCSAQHRSWQCPSVVCIDPESCSAQSVALNNSNSTPNSITQQHHPTTSPNNISQQQPPNPPRGQQQPGIMLSTPSSTQQQQKHANNTQPQHPTTAAQSTIRTPTTPTSQNLEVDKIARKELLHPNPKMSTSSFFFFAGCSLNSKPRG